MFDTKKDDKKKKREHRDGARKREIVETERC